MNFSQLLLKLSSVSILTSILTLLTSFILGQLMTVEDFGTYSLLQSVSMLLINIVPYGTPLAIAVYVNKRNKLKVSKILDNALFVLIPLIFTVVILLWSLYTYIFGRFEMVYIFIIANSILMSINLLFISYLRTIQKIKEYTTHFLFYTVSVTVIGILGYLFFRQVIAFYISIFFCLLLPTFFALKRLYQEFRIGKFKRSKINFFKWSLKYGTPIVASTSVMSFLLVGDKILLGFLSDKITVASYAIAALLASTTLFLVNNFAATWSSYLFRKLSKLTIISTYDFYKKNKYKVLLALPLAFFTYLAQLFVYLLFFSNKYPGLELVILLLNLAYTFLGMAKFFMGFLNYYNKNIYIFYSSFFSALVLIFSSFFTYSIEFFGLSVSVLTSLFVLFVLTMTFTDKVLINNVNE